MKKIVFTLFCLAFLGSMKSQGIAIPETYFGNNAWHINFKESDENLFAAGFEAQLAAAKASGVKYFRIGGITPGWDPLYDFNTQTLAVTNYTRFVYLIEKIRDAGMDVIIQVGVVPPSFTVACQNGYSPTLVNPLSSLSVAQQASVAASLVDYLNNTLKLKVMYWSIGNEPDLAIKTCTNPSGYSLGTESDAGEIADYIKTFSAAMKNKYPQIRIMGPEIASFSTDDFGPTNKLMRALISNPSTSASTSIMGTINDANNLADGQHYIDVISFHYYPGSSFSINADVHGNPTHSTSGFAAKLNSSAVSGRTGLVEMITDAGRNVTNCHIACTEFNIDVDNGITESIATYSTLMNSYDNRGFAGGQWICEVLAEGLKQQSGTIPWAQFTNLWSVKEGECAYDVPSGTRPFGYISGCDETENTKRPMYWHYRLMAAHFKEMFFSLSSITSTVQNVKAFASRSEDKIAVMILNQSSNDYTFEVSLKTPSLAIQGQLNLGFSIAAATGTPLYFADGTNNNTERKLMAHSTVLILFTCTGKPSRRYDYLRSGTYVTTYEPEISSSLGSPLIGDNIVAMANWSGAGGSTLQVSMTNSFTYSWSGPNGIPVTVGPSGQTATLTRPGSSDPANVYTFAATDSEGCRSTQTYCVFTSFTTGGSGFHSQITTVSGSTCGLNTGSACVSANFSATYVWDGGSPITTNCKTGLAPGPHTVEVYLNANLIDRHYCYVHVLPNTKPPIDAGVDRVAYRYCTNTIVAYPDLTLQGYWKYEWYKGNSKVPTSTLNPVVFTNWTSDKYRVRVYDYTTGCENWDSLNIKTIEGMCTSYTLGIAYGVPCDPLFNATYRKSVSIITHTITQDTIINRDYYLDRVLVVPEGITLKIEDCELACATEASIIVQPGGSFKMNKTFMHPCGNNLWGGIKITGLGGGSGGLTFDTITITNSVVKNAEYAITLENTSGAVVDGNMFYGGTAALNLQGTQNFQFSGNRFHGMTDAIRSTESPENNFSSEIAENLFQEVTTAINLQNDDQANLVIVCNRFHNYSDYAIYSANTLMKDQGTVNDGPGNVFNSSSTLTNHQLYHDRNPITYHCDPSFTFTLSQSGGLAATASVANADGVCPKIQVSERAGIADLRDIEFESINVSVYPNPFSDKLTFIYNISGGSGDATLLIMDLTGRVVGSSTLLQTRKELILEGLGLPNGLYICSVTTSQGHSKQFKLICLK
jgi:hypothetical protein